MTQIFTPAGVQHKRLKRLGDHGEDTMVNEEEIGTLYQGDDLKELAWDYYNIEKKGRRTYEPYMDIEEPEQVEGGYIVRKFLTEMGEKALAALEMGWFWDHDGQQEAVQATFNFYRDLMKNNKFTVKHADWIVGNNDERFRELRNEVVYFKLKAKRVGDVFIEDKDAA